MSVAVAPPSLPALLAASGVAAASPILLILDGSPAALAALATAQVAGTVAPGGAPGTLVLLTALGALSVKAPATLPAGTRVVLQAIPGRPDAALVLAINDVPTAPRTTAPAPNAAPPALTTADIPPIVFELGTAVTATILGGADIPPPDGHPGTSAPEADAPDPATPSPVAGRPAEDATRVAASPLASPELSISRSAATPFPPQTTAKSDLAAIFVPSRGTAMTPPDPARPPAPVIPALPSDAARVAAPGTTITVRILAVQSVPVPGSTAVPALSGIVEAGPQGRSGTLVGTPAGLLRIIVAAEPGTDQRGAPPLLPGSRVALRLLAGSPAAALLTVLASEMPPQPTAPAASPADLPGAVTPAPPADDAAQPAAAEPVTYRVLLGEPAIPDPAETQATPRPVIGTVLTAPSTPGVGPTLIATPFGTLAVSERLALPPGTLLLLAPDDVPAVDAPPLGLPGRIDRSWSTLATALGALGEAAPELAAHLRADLSPLSGERLAANLMFLVASLRGGTGRNWPGDTVENALTLGGHGELKLRLGEEFGEIRAIADNPATNPWQVFLLPLIDGTAMRPLRLYLKRRGERARRDASDEHTRFILEFELTRLGTMQLDGFVRPRRFDLVLRSHAALATTLRNEVERIFRARLAAAGIAGTIDFATAARFDVAPLDKLRGGIGLAV